MSRIFLSYSRNDDESFVKRLYSSLVDEGFDVWWDRHSMPSRSLTFLHEIRNAVDECDRLVAVVGPQAVRSQYVKAEWQYALVKDKVVVPILRIGTHEILPPDLAHFHCPDFRTIRPQDEAMGELLRVLREPLPPLGKPHFVPPPPPRFQPRTAAFSQLSERILQDQEQAVVVKDSDRITVLHGMGGVGKSVLAAAFASATSTRKFFVDGVFWLNLRRSVSVEAALDSLGRTLAYKTWLGDDRTAEQKLHDLLADNAWLIVLDNVNTADQVEPLVRSLGTSPSRLLLTTREGGLATSFGANEMRLEVLEEETALRLLADWTGENVDSLPTCAREIAKACGHLPLALSLCGASVADGLSWTDVDESLKLADLEFLEKKFPDYPYPTVLRCLEASMTNLKHADPQGARCFQQLVVFPKGEKVPEQAVMALWGQTEHLHNIYAKKLIVQLERKALVRIYGDQPNRLITTHDLQHDYLCQIESDLQRLHEALLDAYRQQCGGTWSDGSDDGYFLRRLAYHLAAANRLDELELLLLDLRWVERRVQTDGPISTIADYEFLDRSAEASMVKDALKLSSHVIAQEPRQLKAQLAGRLPPHLVDQLLGSPDKFELRPVRASLAPAGGPAVQVLQAAGTVTALVVHPNADLILTASQGGKLEVWDRASGSQICSLQGSGHEPSCIAVAIDVGHILCGYNDAPVEIWDLESKQLLKSIEISGANALSVNPQGQRFVVSASSATVVWDIDADQKLGSIPGKSTAVGITSDGRFGVSVQGGSDAEMIVWDIDTGQRVQHYYLAGENHYVMAGAVSHDAQWVVVACREKISPMEDWPFYLHPNVWHIKTGRVLGGGPRHRDLISAVGVSADGRRGMSATVRGDLISWHVDSSKPSTILSEAGRSVGLIAVAPDGSWAATAEYGELITIWDLERPLQGSLQPHGKSVSCVAFSPDSARLVSVAGEPRALFWDAATGEPIREWRSGTFLLSGIFLPGGCRLVLAGVNGWVLDAETLEPTDLWSELLRSDPLSMSNPFFGARSVAATKNGALLVVGCSDGKVTILDTVSGDIYGSARLHKGAVNGIALDAEDRKAVSCGDDGKVLTWNLSEPAAVRTVTTQRDSVGVVTFVRGNLVAWGGQDGSVRFANVEQEMDPIGIRVHEGEVTVLAPLLAGEALLSASTDRRAFVWMSRSLTIVEKVSFDRPISCGTIAHDESIVALGDISGGVHFLRFRSSIGADSA